MKKFVVTSLLALVLAPVTLAGPGNNAPRGQRSLSELASELHDATRHVSDEARVAARRWRGRETPVSLSLARLDREAARFEKIVDRRGRRDAWRLKNDFLRLRDEFDRAWSVVRRVASPQLRRDFDRVGRLMNRVTIRLDRIAGQRPPYRDGRNARPARHGSIEYDDDHGDRRVRIRIGR